MSRIGVLPLDVPAGVEVSIDNSKVTVRGPKGETDIRILEGTALHEDEEGRLVVTRVDESTTARERHGLVRTLLANAIHGVSQGFSKSLEINGVGFRAQVEGDTIVLNIGYSQPRRVTLPEGITASVEGSVLTITGIDKQRVGQVAADIRRLRPPEPYKGKGIAYTDERIRRKAGKAGGSA